MHYYTHDHHYYRHIPSQSSHNHRITTTIHPSIHPSIHASNYPSIHPSITINPYMHSRTIEIHAGDSRAIESTDAITHRHAFTYLIL